MRISPATQPQSQQNTAGPAYSTRSRTQARAAAAASLPQHNIAQNAQAAVAPVKRSFIANASNRAIGNIQNLVGKALFVTGGAMATAGFLTLVAGMKLQGNAAQRLSNI